MLGQLATDEKSNEITAVPALLEMLNIEGCIITADAMSCQKAITKKVAEKEADYAIGLKENQLNLRRDAADYFTDALADPRNDPELQVVETQEKGHGRVERRKYYLTNQLDWLSGREDWGNLLGLGMVRTKVDKSGTISEETRYYITSLRNVESFARAVRAHWGVENSLHWCLDMTFHEDYSRIRKDNSAENMAVVRHIALDILKHYPEKISLARKRRRCSYDDAFLAKILLSVHA